MVGFTRYKCAVILILMLIVGGINMITALVNSDIGTNKNDRDLKSDRSKKLECKEKCFCIVQCT